MLVSLEDMKIRLGIDPSDTEHDAYLTQQIEAATALIENYCARQFELLEVTQVIRNPNKTLNLTRFPIESISSITTSRGDVILTQNFIIEFELGRAFWSMDGCQWNNDPLLTVLYSGGFDPVPQDLQEVVYDIVTGRYYSQGTNPSQKIKSETVDGIGKMEYAVNNSFYGGAGGYGGFDLNQYAGILDLYKIEGAVAI
jgi:hypothetical protein